MTSENNKQLVDLKPSPVTDQDRLKFAIFLAISLHLILILGVRFVLPENEESPIPLSLDVTLAQRESLEAPKQADFIGQKNQQGAGDSEQAERPATELENFKNTQGETSIPTLELVPEAFQANQELTLVKAIQADKIINQPNESQEQDTPEQIDKQTEITPPPLTLEQHNVEQDIANQLKTRGVRKRQISASIIESEADAAYLEVWRKKIERVGNTYYPEQAKQQGIFGKLMLKVGIARDGSLIDVEILQSSGQPILDRAAIDIVRLAAPFDKFPDAIKKNTDILEIVRIWQFKPDNKLNTR